MTPKCSACGRKINDGEDAFAYEQRRITTTGSRAAWTTRLVVTCLSCAEANR